MDRKAAVTILQPSHLKAEADIAGFEDFGATVVFDRVSL
jgi:hypothetical protein